MGRSLSVIGQRRPRRPPSAARASSLKIPWTNPAPACRGCDAAQICGQSRQFPSPAHCLGAATPGCGPVRCDAWHLRGSAPKAAPPECRRPDTSSHRAPRLCSPARARRRGPPPVKVRLTAPRGRRQTVAHAGRGIAKCSYSGPCKKAAEIMDGEVDRHTAGRGGDFGMPNAPMRSGWRAASGDSRAPTRAGNHAPEHRRTARSARRGRRITLATWQNPEPALRKHRHTARHHNRADVVNIIA